MNHPKLDDNDLAVIRGLKEKAIKAQQYVIAAPLRQAENELKDCILRSLTDDDLRRIREMIVQ